MATCARWVKLNLPYTEKNRKIKNKCPELRYKNKLTPNNIITADEWKLASHSNELLEHFCIAAQQCNKNNALLSSVIQNEVLKKILVIKLTVQRVKVVQQPWQKILKRL